MASLDNNTSASNSSNAQTRGFRLVGDVSDYFKGMTKASEKQASQPYVRVKMDGETTGGKKMKVTIMAFGEKAIANLDIEPTTKRAGVFVAFDRNSRGVVVPVGPYKAD